MTWEEAKKKYGTKIKGVHHNDEEHRIQVACVEWFRKEFPMYYRLLFAIPNGGKRDAFTGKTLKDEGALAGVADLFFAVSNRETHGLFIEMKTPKGRQQDTQKEFEEAVKKQGYGYVVCRSVEEFKKTIIKHLSYE